MDNFIVSVNAFSKNGEGEELYDATSTAAEVFSSESEGDIEIAFNTPSGERLYIGFNLGALVNAAVRFSLPDE